MQLKSQGRDMKMVRAHNQKGTYQFAAIIPKYKLKQTAWMFQ